jgi:hypothetical protein
MQLFVEQLINGCALGSLYAMFAVGFGLVFATLGILNAAHGTYASWAAIAALAATEWLGLPFPLVVLSGVLAGGVLALVVDQIGFQPLRGRDTGMMGALITSIAFWIILDSLAGLATGQQSLSFPRGSYPGTMLHLGTVPLPSHAGGWLERHGCGAGRGQSACRGGRHGVPGRRHLRARRRAGRHPDAERLVQPGPGPDAEGVRRGCRWWV